MPASQSGIPFGPTPTGKYYECLYAHRGAVPGKSVWHTAITPQLEYQLFVNADVSGWCDARGHYWSLKAGGSVPVGTRQERLGKHPLTRNPSDPWHGYPASPALNGDGDMPEDDLIERWLFDRVITRAFARRLRSQRV
jgi:hypothetical protein